MPSPRRISTNALLLRYADALDKAQAETTSVANATRFELSKQLIVVAMAILGAGSLLTSGGFVTATHLDGVRVSGACFGVSIVCGMVYMYRYSAVLYGYATEAASIVRDILSGQLRTLPQFRQRQTTLRAPSSDWLLILQLLMAVTGVVVPLGPTFQLMGASLVDALK